MGRAKWTPSLLNSLLMHIEEHKGENGLYSTNTEAAYKDAANLLTKTFPMTPEQVKNKLTHLFEGDNPVGHEKKALFLKGRCVLRAPYDKATTLDPQGRTSLSNTHDHEDTNPDEPCEEPPARISRDNVTQVEVIRSFNNDQHSRGLSLSLNPDERQQLSSDLSSLRSDESEHEPANNVQAVAPRANSLFGRLPPTTNLSLVVTLPLVDGRGPLARAKLWHMVDQSAAGPSGYVSTPPWAAAQSYIEPVSRVQVALREYLADEPDGYVPSQQTLMDQKSVIMCRIRSEVESLLDLTNPALASQTHMDMGYERLGGERLPRFYEAFSDEDFCNLCLRIYGIGTKTELRAKVVNTPICMNKFLRGFVAAAVTDWVFDERHVSVPQILSSSKIGISRVYEEQVRGVSEKLHEQILLKSRSIYVNNDTNFEPFAFDLSMRLYETFKPFLQSNNLLPTGGDAKAWLEGLKQVFLSSLKLKSQVLLRSGRHDFRLPACDIVFDPEMMTTEEGANMEGNWTVQVALFPALIQITDPQMVMDDAVEVTMFHATVVLQ